MVIKTDFKITGCDDTIRENIGIEIAINRAFFLFV
jgi:hypothetical protein